MSFTEMVTGLLDGFAPSGCPEVAFRHQQNQGSGKITITPSTMNKESKVDVRCSGDGGPICGLCCFHGRGVSVALRKKR